MVVEPGPEFGWVVVTCAALAFQIVMTGFIVVGRARSKVFTEVKMSEFKDEHFLATNQEIKKGGYPDMGNGRYAAKLDYSDWLYFNSAQRVHYNYLEHIASIIAFVSGAADDPQGPVLQAMELRLQ